MPAPSAYTEAELASYMARQLSEVAVVLGWDAQPLQHLQEAVNETLLSYGVASVDLATDIQRVRAIARVQAWSAAADALAAQNDFAADGGDYKLSQMHAQALRQLAAARSDLAVIESAESASTRPASGYLPNKAVW